MQVGVRARILATMLVLTAAAMTVAGAVFVVVQRREVVNHADRVVAADVREFLSFVDAASRGQTGTGVTDAGSLLRAALERQVPADDETFLVLVDGEPRFTPPGPRLVALENQPQLVAAVAALPADAPVRVGPAATTAGPVRYAAVQVRVTGRPEVGTYLVAVATKPALDRVNAAGWRYAAVSLGSLLIVGLVGWLVAGRLLRPLRHVRQAAEHISETDLSLRIPVTGRDDVSDLTRTVNAMLDRLQAAFEVQQQFLDDAGHELRTPVTIVRGHLELLDVHDPVEVGQTRALVLDEMDRMGRLVDDLIVLAKARRPDFLQMGPVDLDRLVEETIEKATGLGQRRWTVDALPHRAAALDAQRVTQALLQLAHNAVQHTREGDEIGLGARVDHGSIQLWVRDSGPGVAGQDAARIFERFGRVRPGRGNGGSGLGLAIVTTIAAAHGGRVELDSVPGHGATFTLHLPGAALILAPGKAWTHPTARPGTPQGAASPVAAATSASGGAGEPG
jgi:signal transduction histidine kinase